MKTPIAILFLATLCLSGCKKDHCQSNKPKPPSGDVQKVPDAPSGLSLSAIAGTAVLAYWVSTRKERVA